MGGSGNRELIKHGGSGPIPEQDERHEEDTTVHHIKEDKEIILESFKKGWEEDLRKN